MTAPIDEINKWIGLLKEGDERAPDVIWQNYFQKVARFAKMRLGNFPARSEDEEDVALSVLNSFIRRAQTGRFPRLDDQNDLWKLLVTITARKVISLKRRHLAKSRAEGRVRGESIFVSNGNEDSAGISEVLGKEPTPEFIVQVGETCENLITHLDDDVLKKIATLKLEGFTNEEVAKQVDLSVRSVERKLNRIREKWSKAMSAEDDE